MVDTTWIDAADDALSVMLDDSTAWESAYIKRGLRPAHMPSEKHKALLEAITDIRRAGKPIHDTTLREGRESRIPLEWLVEVRCLIDAPRRAAFDDNVSIVYRHGMDAGLNGLLDLAQKQVNRDGYQKVISQLLSILPSLGADSSIQRETARETGEDFERHMATEPPPLVLTGIPWIDELTHGLGHGKFWWMVAPYKGRKTTVMLNIALGIIMSCLDASKQPPSAAIMSGEMLRREIVAQCVAMLAIVYLLRQGRYNDVDDKGKPLNLIYGELLLKAGVNYRKWHPVRVAAVNWGIEQWKRMDKCLRVYDRTDKGGRLHTFNDLQNAITRDMYLHGGRFFFVDYLQVFSTGERADDDYDRNKLGSYLLQDIVKGKGATIFLTAQQNEQTIREGYTYSPGVKGGGAAAQTAEYLMTAHYKTGDLPKDGSQIQLQMHLGRFVPSTENDPLEIHPPSGLLLQNTWIRPKQIEV
jgi:hypothetical protein